MYQCGSKRSNQDNDVKFLSGSLRSGDYGWLSSKTKQAERVASTERGDRTERKVINEWVPTSPQWEFYLVEFSTKRKTIDS